MTSPRGTRARGLLVRVVVELMILAAAVAVVVVGMAAFSAAWGGR